jgi:zinc finger-like protein
LFGKGTKVIFIDFVSSFPHSSTSHYYYPKLYSADASNYANKEPPSFVPLFTETELTPTYRYSEEKGSMVLGCSHYARACKLRHPETGNLFTCRLCCQELRENSSKGYLLDLPALDRYSVTEILCMRCGSLQPTGPKCINPLCISDSKESPSGSVFAKYYCSICNLFDDETKTIYHCPFCNVCRIGKGLGIDFRHCMVRFVKS